MLVLHKDYMYHCVSINTIYDCTFRIPNIGDKDISNIPYVFHQKQYILCIVCIEVYNVI